MKKNLITKTLFLAMGLCVASGITATLVSTNKSAVAVHAEARRIGDSDTFWELINENTTLIISGIGEIPEQGYDDAYNVQPWKDYIVNITDIVIESGVTEIGALAFNNHLSLENVTIPSTVETIGEDAFYNCGFTTIELPVGVTTIGYGAFRSCSRLTNITLPDGLISISTSAFYETGLVTVTIPSTVVQINTFAFEFCSDLETVTVEAITPPDIGDCVFDFCDKLEKIYVPAESVDEYQTAWADYADKIEALHVHAIKEIHDKVDSTCLEAGHKVYYECECGKYFSDEALTQEITNLQVWLAEGGEGYIAPKGHSTTKVPGVAATNTTDGFKDAYKCNACGKYFEDADETKLIGDETAYNAWKLGEGKIPALNPQGNKGLSGGAIAGIAVGSAVVVGLGVFSLIWFGIKKKTFADLIGIFKK